MNRSNAVKYDRLATPHSLAVEMPFLLPDVLTIGLHLPDALKFDGAESKPLLKDLAIRYFPREWIYAPKFGFPAPLPGWLRGPLAPWVAALSQERAVRRGIYNQALIAKLDPDRDGDVLWTVAALEMFLRQFVDGEGLDGAKLA
jgi:asparagine synthetase B (glutamine-hydrolysing)